MSARCVPPESELSAALRGFGTARADLAGISALRKSLPAWAPSDTPGHFLKHADEQTVLAVAALDQTIRCSGMKADDYRDWAIIAAPRFIGRIAGAITLDRFTRGGGPAISPHTIPQHSLHSISGALSILLASRQPNFGVGGTADSLAEGLLAALTFPRVNCSGVWLVSTAWDPEPQVDLQGNCENGPICHAVVLALAVAAGTQDCGRLHLTASRMRKLPGKVQFPDDRESSALNAAGLCQALASLTPGGPSRRFTWGLSWGAKLLLEAHEKLTGLAAAA
jgi:hypothetical protein